MKQLAFFKLALLTLLVMGFTSCQERSEVEFYLPGTWYTEQAIDYGDSSVWGSGTQLVFSSSSNQGIIGTEISSEFLIFTWRWHNEGYNTLEIRFMDGTYAYINGIEASSNRLTGTWYNSYWEFEDRIDGQTFRMRRIN